MARKRLILVMVLASLFLLACEAKEEENIPTNFSPQTFHGQTVKKAKDLGQISKKHQQELDDSTNE